MNYSDFLRLLDFTSNDTVERIISDIRAAIIEDLGPGLHCARSMKEMFARFDANADGRIDKDEFLRR